MSTCDKCGSQITEGANFCLRCGAALKLTPPPPPPPVNGPVPPRPSALDDLIGRPPALRPVVAEKRGTSIVPLLLALAALVFGGVLLYFMIRWNDGRTADLAAVQRSLELINQRLEQGDRKAASFESKAQVMQEHMGLTESELKRAQALARQLQTEQARNVRALTDQIAAKADTEKVETIKQESETKIAGVSQDVSQVRDEVRTGQQELDKTKAELARVGVLVTEQGSMIATNAGGLDELRRRGEREYVSFDVRKKQRENLAGIGLELRKADVGKQFVDFKVFVDDRTMEHKKIYVNKPVTFYAGRNRSLYEVVVNEVKKDQMVGYVSMPKYGGSANAAANK